MTGDEVGREGDESRSQVVKTGRLGSLRLGRRRGPDRPRPPRVHLWTPDTYKGPSTSGAGDECHTDMRKGSGSREPRDPVSHGRRERCRRVLEGR